MDFFQVVSFNWIQKVKIFLRFGPYVIHWKIKNPLCIEYCICGIQISEHRKCTPNLTKFQHKVNLLIFFKIEWLSTSEWGYLSAMFVSSMLYIYILYYASSFASPVPSRDALMNISHVYFKCLSGDIALFGFSVCEHLLWFHNLRVFI